MESKPLVSIVMGSQSDLDTLEEASAVLKEFSVPHEIRVISAHRTPDVARDFALSAEDRGVKADRLSQGNVRRGCESGSGVRASLSMA